MRSSLRGLFVMLPLVGVLTWLLLHSVGPLGAQYVVAQRDVARVSLSEAGLRRDVLLARAALLRNYDPLVEDVAELRQAGAELHRQAMVRREDRALSIRLMEKIGEDEASVELFKTDNALLQNSLAYFDVLDTRLAGADVDPALSAAIRALGNSVLHLTRDPGVSVQRVVEQRLEALAALPVVEPGRKRDVNLLITHGRLLLRLLPGVDEDLRALFSISTYDLRQAIRTSQDERRTAEEARAGRFRLALYGVAILLSVMLVRIGLQLRAGLRLLRERTELEYLIADTSTRFMTGSLDQYETLLAQLPSRLGQAFGADRAYLLFENPAEPSRSWSRSGTGQVDSSQSPDWQGVILKSAFALAGETNDLIDVPMVMELEAGHLRSQLKAVTTTGWCGMVLRDNTDRVGLLAFDRVHARKPWPRGGAGTVRLAGDMISHILQHRQSALQRIKLENSLSRARRLEAVGTFASGIAHNFNNVIGVVLGHAEMAAAIVPAGSPCAYHVQEIDRAAERAQKLVGRILEFGTRGSAAHEMLSIDSLLDETAAMLRVLLPIDIELVVRTQSTGRFIRGDVTQLQQILLNLVRNAAQAMEDAGQIVLQTSTLHLSEARKLSHDALPAGDYEQFCVIDTGKGMDATVLARIFQPFFTTRPAGTGLGLATVREIVHDHDGAIDVQSMLGQGAAFTVWLPSRAASGVTSTITGCCTGQTVLLLAPEPSIVLHDEEMLAALGYEPVGFSRVDAALAAALASPEQFDAMMIDLPKLDVIGLGILTGLAEIMPLCPTVLITHDLMEVSSVELASRGIDRILQRPLVSANLAAALLHCLKNR